MDIMTFISESKTNTSMSSYTEYQPSGAPTYKSIGQRWESSINVYRKKRTVILACVHNYITVNVLATLVIDYAMY